MGLLYILIAFWLVQCIEYFFLAFENLLRGFKKILNTFRKRAFKIICKSQWTPSRLRNLMVTIVPSPHCYCKLEMGGNDFPLLPIFPVENNIKTLDEKESSAFNVIYSFQWISFLSKMWKNFSLKNYIPDNTFCMLPLFITLKMPTNTFLVVPGLLNWLQVSLQRPFTIEVKSLKQLLRRVL